MRWLLVEEAIRRVQIGTDKTAAELAIPRLEKELNDAKQALVDASSGNAGPGCAVLFLGPLFAIGAGIAVGGDPGILVFLVLFIGAFVAANYTFKAWRPDTTAQRTRIAEIEERQRNAKNIADG